MTLCDNCGGYYHPMDMFDASGFGKDEVCTACVCEFLREGEWVDRDRNRLGGNNE